MRLYRFIGNFDLTEPSSEIGDDVAYQMRTVLRLRDGDEVILGDGRGKEALCRIIDVGKRTITVTVGKVKENKNEPNRSVTLYCAILKRENFELVVQKATEVGVTKIVPLITARTVKTGLKRDRLEKIIREAAEQSGRGILPTLEDFLSFARAIKQVEGTPLFFDETGDVFPKNLDREVCIFIGPEGGWSEAEQEVARGHNFKIVSLGPLTLRAETAAIVASYLVFMVS